MSPNNCDKCGHDQNMCECPKGSEQVGGDHYEADYQHWDYIADTCTGYLEGNASKYILRWKDKGKPLEDLGKARSYICKALELYNDGRYYNSSLFVNMSDFISNRANFDFNKFVARNHVPDKEARIICYINRWQFSGDLSNIIELIDELFVEAQEALAEPRIAGGGNGPQMQSNDVTGRSQSGAGGTKGRGAASSTSVEHPFGYDSKREL